MSPQIAGWSTKAKLAIRWMACVIFCVAVYNACAQQVGPHEAHTSAAGTGGASNES